MGGQGGCRPGAVEADELRALVDGRHPGTGEELLAGSRPRSVRAFDLTLSCPKSVSLLWALGTDGVAEVVAAAHREAVDVALGFLEERAATARQQVGGVRRRVATNGWVVAGFVHRTSREGDPQLHTHCLVPNLVQRRMDGRFVALDAGPLFEWARAAGSVYQNHLQRALSLRLGVTWGPDHHNTREIDGFSREQLRAFSKRSVQIEAELEARGECYESPALRMQADDVASLATRTAKDHSLSPTLLAARWREEADDVNLAKGTDLDQSVCWAESPVTPPGWDEITGALIDSETGLCSRSARFTRAHVVEHICALSGGRLSAEEVTGAAERFLASELAVRLTPDDESGHRRPAQWSTAAHRALEDRTLALVDALAARHVPAVTATEVDAALAEAPELGGDQASAVRALTGQGGALRSVFAPAGYGKTTMLHTAARAAAADGRPVIAVATTAKAVAELAGAGLDAYTIARLRVDLAAGPLGAGTVLVLDEISQTPTDQVEAVLAAADACPGGQVWVLGDPRQSQPVGASGMADHLEALAAEGRIPSARLSVNRRQVHAADRAALDLLRRGDAAASQQVRSEHGWEHAQASPAETRGAMADAVCEGIAEHGADQVAALVVSHGDAEDLADRIRTRLAAAGRLTGPALTGPGWTTDRTYRAGDRVLLHARCGKPDSLLVNGTTATVTAVRDDGLAVRLDRGTETLLPSVFATGARRDGAPNLSHAWARTVDGAQGGTWEACHLLGSSALDAYRGYTGQSRSRRPTHTWNTSRLGVVDHGGVLADRRDGVEQVVDALSRHPDPTLAARSDPWVLDRQLRERIAEHERVLDVQAPEPHRDHDVDEGFEAAEGWRRDDVSRLREQLEHHWARVVAGCVGADDPLAYGIDKLRHARATFDADRRSIDIGVPEDRTKQWQEAHERLPGVCGDRHSAEAALVDSRAQLDGASRRRWARLDQRAFADAQLHVSAAERRVQQALSAERDLRDRLAALADHQQRRQQALADVAAQRKQIDATLARVDAALAATRPDRVAALADDPPRHLVARLDAPPTTPAGRAVWCHHALDVEAALDRNDGRAPAWAGWSPQSDRARHQIAVADRVLQASDPHPQPTEWAALAVQARSVLDHARRAERMRARQGTKRPSPGAPPASWVDPAAERTSPGLSL